MHERWRHKTTGEVVLLDNRDSFVFNLAHRFWEAGQPVVVVRSDAVDVDELERWSPAALVVSPGPGHPRDAGCSVEAIRRFNGMVPILGVCLGHQAIATAFGGAVTANGTPRHGKNSMVAHDERGLFSGLPNPLEVGRYHALSIEGAIPTELVVTAEVDGLVMGVRHRQEPTFGVQFHPESVLTPDGLGLIRNFCQLVA